MIFRRTRTALLGICLAGLCAAAEARSIQYALELPARQRLTYRVEFEVAHPGQVVVEAGWDESRVLVFRLERPGQRPMRVAGPSPQRFVVDVAAGEIRDDQPWTLTITGLPSRDATDGRLTIELPESPAAVQAKIEEAQAPPPPPQADPWMLEVEAPPGIGYERLRLYEAIERFRRLVVDSEVPDGYRWQEEMLRYLARVREEAALEPATRETLRQVVEIIHELDDLRTIESDPLGKAPTDAVSRRVWDRVRDPRFEPVSEEIDAVMVRLHDGGASQLVDELWFTNLMSCLIICERHFEQRTRLGEKRAANGELVHAQWPVLLGAAEAFEALHSLD